MSENEYRATLSIAATRCIWADSLEDANRQAGEFVKMLKGNLPVEGLDDIAIGYTVKEVSDR